MSTHKTDTVRFIPGRSQRAALGQLNQAMRVAGSSGLLMKMSADDFGNMAFIQFSEKLKQMTAQMTPAPVHHIRNVCDDFDDSSISSVGANAALGAMLPHWEDHLLDGSDPTIICGDINDLMQRLSVMRDEVMRLVAEDAAKPQDEPTPGP
jgi:hypothetical protein